MQAGPRDGAAWAVGLGLGFLLSRTVLTRQLAYEPNSPLIHYCILHIIPNMRIASIVAVLTTTAVLVIRSARAQSPDDLTAIANHSTTDGSASDWGSNSAESDSSCNEDSSSSTNEDSSSSGDGSFATETLAPTTPTPTPPPTSATPVVRKVRIRVKVAPLPRALESLCGPKDDEMSVEGVEGVFCIRKGMGCSGANAWGKCPGRQTGLPHGSYCGRIVASGVFGCKPGMPYGEVPDWDDVTDKDDKKGDKDGDKVDDHGVGDKDADHKGDAKGDPKGDDHGDDNDANKGVDSGDVKGDDDSDDHGDKGSEGDKDDLTDRNSGNNGDKGDGRDSDVSSSSSNDGDDSSSSSGPGST